jgi:hypothetical protein
MEVFPKIKISDRKKCVIEKAKAVMEETAFGRKN